MLYPSYILANNVVNSELVMERGWREMAPTCPRCGSSNTKFCYYNNYSLTQPRYFCKGCRRYWTKGGSLRNVPVGGGCRKSRRSRSSTLRLATTPSNHRHNNTPMYSHNDHHLGGHASYGNMSNMGDDSTTSPINSEVPTIDLAAVYANYLNQKPEISTNEVVLANCGGYNNNNNPTVVELSNIPDATQIAPTSQVVLQQHHNTFVHCNDITTTNNNNNRPICPNDDNNNNNNDNHHHPFSETVLPMSELMSNIDHQNQVLYVTEFSRPLLNDEMSMQPEHLGLLPLPGEALISQDHYNQQHQHMPPWPSSNLTVVDSNLQVPIRHHHHHPQLQNLESEPQFSTMFNNGSWSPLDLQGFETTTSSSKP